jgi:hypothetical protein
MGGRVGAGTRSAVCTRVSMAQLPPLPSGCQFELLMQSHDAQPPPLAQETPDGHEPVWLDAHPDTANYTIATPALVPLRSVDTPPLSLRLFVELLP